MILSTLAELEEEPAKKEETSKNPHNEPKSSPKPLVSNVDENNFSEEEIQESTSKQEYESDFENITANDEREFCESMRERILVLFEGFQSPNNKNIEAKVDMTLNFLEYLLAVIDERLEILDSKRK